MSGIFAHYMQGGGWAVFALAAAGFSAVLYLINQHLKQPGYLLVFWMRVLLVVVLTPLVATLQWPDSPKFYGVVALTVVFSTFGDIRTFDVSARYGGGVVSRLQPLVVWGAFFVWFALDPALLDRYAQQPLNALGILTALGGCVYFSMRMNRSAVNRSAFMEMLPALFAYTATTVLNKYALMQGPAKDTVYSYMYVQSVLTVPLAGGYALWRLSRRGEAGAVQLPADVHPRAALPLAVVVVAAAWLCHMIYKNYAMVFAASPSYVAALGLTAPVFIALYYRFTGHREEAETLSGYGIVLCALALVVFTLR